MRAVNVEALSPCSAVQIQYVSIAFTWSGLASPRQRSRTSRRPSRLAATTSSGAGKRPSWTAADLATIDIICAESRARSSWACSASMSTSFLSSRPRTAARSRPGGRTARCRSARPARTARDQASRARVLVDEQDPRPSRTRRARRAPRCRRRDSEGATFPVRLGDLGLEGDDAFEPWLEVAHLPGNL